MCSFLCSSWHPQCALGADLRVSEFDCNQFGSYATQHVATTQCVLSTTMGLCGVLCCFRAGNSAEALALMQEATQSMMVDATPAMHKITIGYNIARLQEASGGCLWGGWVEGGD